MTRLGVLLLAGCLAWAAAPCLADDAAQKAVPAPATGTAVVESTAPAPSPAAEAVETAGPECEPPSHLSGLAGRFMPTGECARRAWDWLTYRPESCPRCCSGCGRTCAPTCVPPLYTYFLWQCQAGTGGMGGQCCGTHATELLSISQGEITQPAVPSPQQEPNR